MPSLPLDFLSPRPSDPGFRETIHGDELTASYLLHLLSGLDDPVSPLFIGAAVLAIGLAISARAVSKREPESAPPPRRLQGSEFRRFGWSLAFFVVAATTLAVLALTGLFH